MKNLFFTLLLFMFVFNSDMALCADKHSKEGGGMDECSIDKDKSGQEGNCNDYINILDGTECLWQISGQGDGASINSFLSNSTATKYLGTLSDVWGYKYRDSNGVASECRSGFPSVNERMYLMRQASTTAEGEVEYLVGRDYCTDRWIWSSTGEWHCNWSEDENGNPNGTHWVDRYQMVFTNSDVMPNDGDTGKKILRGIAWGHHVCLKRTKRNEKFVHSSNINTSARSKVCAYVVNAAGGCNSYFGDASSALIGCVDEPNLPGPDVFNSVVPAEIAPRVDTSICLDSNLFSEQCSKTKTSLIQRGSTFDKPMVVMTGGEVSSIRNPDGSITSNTAVSLELRYQFYRADYDNDIKSCGKMNLEGYSNIEYCAQVPANNPGKVCACEKDPNFRLPEDPNSIVPLNFCGSNKFIGCVDRPTLEHSGLTIVSESKVYKHPQTLTKFPAAQVSFAKTVDDGSRKAHYSDKDNKDACYNKTEGKFYECSDDTKLSKEPVKLKKRLPIPFENDNNSLIREYYPNISLPPYEGNYSRDKGFCKDEDDKDVHYGTSGEFFRLDSDGHITSRKAKGDVVCKVNGKTFKSRDKSAEPQGYLRDSKKYYGIEFTTMIPNIDADGNIQFGRYTSGLDYSESERVCMPVRNAGLCDNIGRTHFIPSGERNRDYCPKVPDQSNDNDNPKNDPKCAPLAKGNNQPEAMKLFCPGSVKKVKAGSGDKVCLDANAGEWAYKTIAEYYAVKRGDIPKFSDTCRKPYFGEYCSSSSGALTIDAITEPLQESAFALWEETVPSTTDTGICSEELGYTVRKKNSVYDYTQTLICNKSPAVTGTQCSTRYANFISTKAILDAKLLDEATKAWNRRNKNLTSAEIMSIIQTPLAPFVAGTGTNGKDYVWYIVNVPPSRVIDKYGEATYSNACVITETPPPLPPAG